MPDPFPIAQASSTQVNPYGALASMRMIHGLSGLPDYQASALVNLTNQLGNPRIEQGGGRPRFELGLTGNTIKNVDSRDDLIAELAHQKHQGQSYLRGTIANAKNIWDKLRLGDDARYTTPGALEHTVHSGVEDQVRQQFNRLSQGTLQSTLGMLSEDGRREYIQQLLDQAGDEGKLIQQLGDIGAIDPNEVAEIYNNAEGTPDLPDVLSNLIGSKRKTGGMLPRKSRDRSMYKPLLLPSYNTATGKMGLGGWLKDNAGAIGTVAGAGIGAFAGNPMLGAQLGGMAGGMAQNALTEEEQRKAQISQRDFDYGGSGAVQQFARGGMLKIRGRKHSQGGVNIQPGIEGEGGETIQPISGSNYVFSDQLKVPGSMLTFADYHEALVDRGADQAELENLASLQEQVAGRNQSTGMSTMKSGGKYYAIKASETSGDDPKYPINSAKDVKDAWKLRNHGDYNISTKKLEERIKRKAREYDVDLPTDSDKQLGGPLPDPPYASTLPQVDYSPIPGVFLQGPSGGNMLQGTMWEGMGAAKSQFDEIGRQYSQGVSNQSLVDTYGQGMVDWFNNVNRNIGAYNQPSTPSQPKQQAAASAADTQQGSRSPNASVESRVADLPTSSEGSAYAAAFPGVPEMVMPTAIQGIPGSGGGGGNQGRGINLNVPDNLGDAVPYIPGAINTLRGLFGSTDVGRTPRVRISREGVNEARQMDTTINVRPQMAMAAQSFRNIQADPNATQQQKRAAYSKLLNMRQQIQSQKENKETQLRNRRQELVSRLLSDIGTREALANQRAGMQQQQLDLQAEAAKSNLLSTGISQMAQAKIMQDAQTAAERGDIQGLIGGMGGYDPRVQIDILEGIMPTIQNEEMKGAIQRYLRKLKQNQ